MSIVVIDIEQQIDENNIVDEIKKILDILLKAINDWPEISLTFEEYAIQVEKFINAPVTKENLAKALKNINFLAYAWNAESLSILMEIYLYYDANLTLNQIIAEINKSLPQNLL